MNRRNRFFLLSFLAVACALALAACGGGPTSPSAQGVVLHGTVMGSAGTASVSALSTRSTSEVVTVTVQEDPRITTTVGPDGSFTLRGLPDGSFTLVFSVGGTTIGTITISGVQPNQEITITVQINGSSVTLLEDQRNGIGHGDVEIEGTVDAVIALDPTGDSRFLIEGHTVVARPGETTIREGNRSRTVSDVTVGRRVHVKGVWLAPAEGSTTQDVLAHEIILQDNDNGDNNDGNNGSPHDWCFAAGAKAEVEGKISSKGSSDITVTQQGKGDFRCLVGADTRIRKGNTTFTFDQLQTGMRVHVKGSGLGRTGDVCQVQANEVMVQ